MAQSLKDFFTTEIKEKLTGIEVSLKGILLIRIPEYTDINYEKFAVLIARSACGGFIGLVTINTDKSFSGNCVAINPDQYPFLNHESHIGCDFISEKPIDEMRKYLLNNPQNIKGEITDFHHAQVLQKLQASKGITPKLKKKFGLI